MKRSSIFRFLLLASLITFAGSQTTNAQFLKKLAHHVKEAAEDGVDQATTNHAVNDAGNATDKVITKGENAVGKAAKGKKRSNENNNAGADTDSNNNSNASANNAGNHNAAASTTPSVKSYQNYDFVPGDTILFADDFTEDQDGEFPSHWTLDKGQAVINKVTGKSAFLLTEGNYCQVNPRMKTKSYLTDPFTIEFDYYANDGDGPGISFGFKNPGNDYLTTGYLEFNCSGEVSTFDLPVGFDAKYPKEDDATYRNQWHHCAMIYKNNQVKCYIDQYRILVIPDLKIIPETFGFAGIGSEESPIIITNVRLASGGGMNMIGKKFTEAKIVTHGITFDIDKSDIKPQSMGTLNMIVGVLKSNPDLKFEIDGHTDNTGQAAHNLTLSQQRAEAVKTQLVKMGIDGSRLTTKGFGDTKPISDNDSPEGKANNRRVEFVKQ